MSWKADGRPQPVKVTRKLAETWAAMDAAHQDRPLSERRLDVYRRVLAEGGFRPVSWAKVYCKETGQWYRVNGKHTSTLFSSLDPKKPFPEQWVVIESFKADTLEDVARLYSTFDSRTQMRTVSDINRSFAASIPELADIHPRVIDLMVSGLAFATWPTSEGGHGDENLTAVDRAELLFDNVEVVLWLTKLVQRVPSQMHLCRQPVVASMIGSWRKNKTEATEFWTAVRDETDPIPESASRKLAKWLLTMNMSRGANSSGIARKYKAGPREFYVRCVKYWNAWRDGREEVDVRYYADSEIPEIE
jgi:hypothetical protein